jgi:hypothetical protein
MEKWNFPTLLKPTSPWKILNICKAPTTSLIYHLENRDGKMELCALELPKRETTDGTTQRGSSPAQEDPYLT